MMKRHLPEANTRRPLVIEPQNGWRVIDIQALYQYRDLFRFFVWRDIKVLYKQTVLGFLWAVIRPVLSMIIFSIVFGVLAKMPSDNTPYPIFTYAALIPWSYFSAALTTSAQSLVMNANMITKVYFPRLVIPLTPVLAGLVDFFISFTVLAILMTWYGIAPAAGVVILPGLILLMMLTAAGMGMWLSALAIQYRDVRHALPFMTQLLMYAAPVIWPVSLVPETYRTVYGLYPMAGVIEGFRSVLLGTVSIPWDLILSGSLSGVIIFLSGAFYFRRTERVFADVA